jgi:parallel beta-helix repeat protein
MSFFSEKNNVQVNQLSSQMAQIVTVNVKQFGAIGDANFFNDANNKYYSDSSFTTLATDNKNAFASILAYTNIKKGKYKILFPEGNYYSSSPFEVSAESVHIEGNHAKLITSVANSSAEIYCVYIRECKKFRCHGMEFENIIEDKSISSSYTGRYYHIWLRGDGVNKIEYCNIYDNIFIDKVSIPNSTGKPFNGSIWLTEAKNISIHDNKFYNNCGRIIYLSGCENGDIYGNKMENVGFIPTEITNVGVGTLCVRLLSGKNIKVHDNTIVGTTIDNAKQISVSGATLATSDGALTPNDGIQVYNNTYIANATKFITYNLYGTINTSIFENDITLNPNSTLFTILSSIANDYERVDVKFENNRINKAHSGVLGLDFSSTYANLVKIMLKGNTFNSDTLLTKITNNTNGIINTTCLDFNNNHIYQSNKYKYTMKSVSEIDYNSMSKSILLIDSTSYSSYLIDGILNVPEDTKYVEFNTTGMTAITITDIKFNNAYHDKREIGLLVKAGSITVTIKSDSNYIRIPNGDIVLSVYNSAKLYYSINRWYKLG